MSLNPFGEFREECRTVIKNSFEKALSGFSTPSFKLNVPPTSEFGELTSSICFDLSRKFRVPPRKLAEKILKKIDLAKSSLIKNVKVDGGGYLNFYVNYPKLSYLALKSAINLDNSYGYVKTSLPIELIVEHTSVNPAGPIHIGTARNSLLGDALSRLLRARGHKVSTHFYLDDVGRQAAIVTYGYKMLGETSPKGKPDHWVGLIYAATSCIIAIQSLKNEIKQLEKKGGKPTENIERFQKELDEWVSAALEIQQKDVELFDALRKKIEQSKDPNDTIGMIARLYETEDQNTKNVVREVVNLCIKGFKETYNQVKIFWDSWDWESDLVWSGDVSKVIEKLKKTPYVIESEGSLTMDVEEVAKALNLKKLFRISEKYEISPLVLTRSDGTTLYTTRDIAYTFWKFRHAKKIINVIGTEQTLAQIQLRVAISLLASPKKAKDLIHYAYELVDLPGYKMSKRRGRYVTFDDILKESIRRAFNEVKKRSPQLPATEKKKIAEIIGIGAVKYALISIDPHKRVVFSWKKVLNFENNSSPFINYAYTRACGILNKVGNIPNSIDYETLNIPLERELIILISKFPEVFIFATEDMRPQNIANYANMLAEKFHKYYEKASIIHAESRSVRTARAALVKSVQIVLRNAMRLIGIEFTENM